MGQGYVNSDQECFASLVQDGTPFFLDRRGPSAGEKLSEMELFGSPVRIVIGNRFKNSREFEVRTIEGPSKAGSVEAIYSFLEKC